MSAARRLFTLAGRWRSANMKIPSYCKVEHSSGHAFARDHGLARQPRQARGRSILSGKERIAWRNIAAILAA
jgi:hypothetical protein